MTNDTIEYTKTISTELTIKDVWNEFNHHCYRKRRNYHSDHCEKICCIGADCDMVCVKCTRYCNFDTCPRLHKLLSG